MLDWLRRKLHDDSDEKRDSVKKMLGEFFRELGVLAIVFYPIEGELETGPKVSWKLSQLGFCVFCWNADRKETVMIPYIIGMAVVGLGATFLLDDKKTVPEGQKIRVSPDTAFLAAAAEEHEAHQVK